jgi:PAS domain S-box-containing protein
VEVRQQSSADEITRLRTCVNDLAGLAASPGLWTDREAPPTVRRLLDALSEIVVDVDNRLSQYARDLATANDALRESARNAELVMDSIPAGAAIMAPNGEVEFVNHRMIEYFGKTPEELKQWGTSDAVHADDLPHVVAAFTHSLATGDPYDTEERLRRFDGRYRWFQVRGLPLRDAHGGVVRWYVLHTDIDDRKRAEEALRESERESRLIVDSIPGLVAILTSSGELAAVNDRVVEYCGRSREELQEWTTNDILHLDDRSRVVELFAGLITSGRPSDWEARIRRFDGVYRWFQFRALPLRDTSGNVVKWYALLTDIDDLKRAEEALREGEREFRLLVETIPALVWRGTPEGELDYLNQRAVEYLGHTAQSLSGGRWLELVHPDQRDATLRRWQHSATTGSSYDDVYQLRRADGEYRWIQSVGRPLYDTEGRIAHWYGVIVDIDDRKRAEEELRRSEAFLAQGQRLTQTGSLWWEVSTGEVIWSDETFRIMNVPKSTKPTVEVALNCIHPEDIALARQMVERSARDGADMDYELRLLMSDGSIKDVHVVLQNIERQSGKPQFVGAVTDITERRRAEAELRRAYDHLTEAQRLSQTGSFTSDLERDEHFWSDEFYRICDFEPGSPVTIQRLGTIVHPEDVALYEGAIGRAMAGTDPDFYFRIMTSRGVVKHLRGFAHRIADRPVFVGAVQDVTASKMAQEALNKAGAELARVSRVTTMSALTASIAHEVNQPLSGIVTNAGTCLRMLDAVPPDLDGARETARRTIRDGNRASDVITRLRALFIRKEFTVEPMDLNEATREVIALSSNDLQRHRVILHSELADALPLVAGDRIQLQQVIVNLVRNAADAMVDVHDRPRQLLIRTEYTGDDRVRLTVRDVGLGLPPQNANALFDAFHTTKSGGMGIGLFVSRSIIEQHRGRLWAEPNDGAPGATFSFSIPCDTQNRNGVSAMATA